MVVHIGDIQGKKLPVKGGGTCIYCGSDGGVEGLRDEHIMPYSLSGNTELLQASCRRCEGVTSYLDGYLANATFGHFRAHSNVQSRTGHPDILPAVIELAEGQKVVDLMVKDHPFFLNMPVWPLPGLMRGAQPSGEFPPAYTHLYWSIPDNVGEILNLRPSEVARVRDTSRMPNLRAFARGIAKIAYGHAVMQYGLDGFRPLALPDLILGKYPYISHFVGSELGNPPARLKKGVMHTVEFVDVVYQRIKFLTVRLRLFAHAGTAENGMPIYTVVVGQEYKPRCNARHGEPVLPRQIIL